MMQEAGFNSSRNNRMLFSYVAEEMDVGSNAQTFQGAPKPS